MARQERREQFVEAAIQVIRRKGAGVSMAEIAAEAGVSKPILYRHVGDRAGLYLTMADRFVTESLAGHTGPPLRGRPLAEKTIGAFIDFVEREPELYRFLREGPGEGGEGATADFVRSVGERVGALMRDFGAPERQAAVWGQAVAGAINAAASWWIDGAGGDDRPRLRRDELVDQLTSLLWDGVRTGASAWAPDPVDVTSR